jgi:two-component system, NarL family, response regulator YdfI
VISVLVSAPSIVVRAGLEALARAHPNIEVLGTAAPGEELQRKALQMSPDVVLIEVDANAADVLQSLQGLPVVLLANENALPLLRNGARAVLPHGASAHEIGLAIEAAAAGLMLMHPDSIEAPISEPSLTSLTSGTLSTREVEVLRMLSEGFANKEIAYRLGISEHTVKFHVGSLFQKLNASSRTEAVTLGVRQGLIML